MGYSLLGAIIFALDLVAIASVVMGRGSVGHKVGWTVAILMLPLLGMILYYLVGREAVDA